MAASRKHGWQEECGEQLTNGGLNCAVRHTVGQHRMQLSGQVGHNARMLQTVAEGVHAEQAIQGRSRKARKQIELDLARWARWQLIRYFVCAFLACLGAFAFCTILWGWWR